MANLLLFKNFWLETLSKSVVIGAHRIGSPSNPKAANPFEGSKNSKSDETGDAEFKAELPKFLKGHHTNLGPKLANVYKQGDPS